MKEREKTHIEQQLEYYAQLLEFCVVTNSYEHAAAQKVLEAADRLKADYQMKEILKKRFKK